MPGKKVEDRASFIYKCFLVHFSASPSIGPEPRNGTNGSLEVDHALLIWILRIRDNLLRRGLRSQGIEESVKTEALEKWLYTQIQVDGGRQLRLWQIFYPYPYLVKISKNSIYSLCKSYSCLSAHMQTLGFLHYMFK